MRTRIVVIVAALAMFAGIAAIPVPAQAAHSVDLTMANTTCNTTQTCTAQFYKLNAACPSDGTIGTGLAWVALTTTLAASTSTTTSQTFTFTDSQVSSGQTVCYYGTNTYVAGVDGPSGPSNTFQGKIPGPPNKGNLNGKVN